MTGEGVGVRKTYASFTGIEQDHPIRETTDGRFLRELKLGLLLALREQGLLTDPQLRLAMEQLHRAE